LLQAYGGQESMDSVHFHSKDVDLEVDVDVEIGRDTQNVADMVKEG